MARLLRLALVATLAIFLLVVFQQTGTLQGPRDADAAFIGDANCDADVDMEDVIAVLRGVSQVQGAGDCVPSLNVDCDTDSDAADALKILQFLADVEQAPIGDCAAVDAVSEGTSNQELASDLAQRITGASSDDARYRALLKVMEVLRIGVYTSDGVAIRQGAERGPGDFYLYDFELRMMAASLGREDNSWGVQQIADTLDQAGYREDGQPFTGDNLNQILHESTNDSLATSNEESSLLSLLVRELGLRHEKPYDLADELDLNEANFDGLQVLLILAGLTLPAISEEAPLDTAASTLVAESNGILTAEEVGVTDEPCSDFKGEGSVYVPKVFLTAVSVVSTVAKKAAAFINIVHGEQLALSIQVKALDSSVGPTHYDHGPENPGQPLKFRIEVRMLDDLGETLVKCGWLATADYPPKGPIPGVRVSFESIQSSLKDHGTLDCTGQLCDRTTGPDGVATLTFDPKSETQPYGQGLEQEVSGVISGVAWYQSKFKNLYGTLAQLLVPKYGSTRWFVRYHNSCPFAGGASVPGSISIAAINGLDQLPCTWTGTGNGSIHHSLGAWDEVGEISGTVTFGNPRLGANWVMYEVISLSGTWQGSEVMPDICPPFSDSGTYDEPQGALIVTDNGSGQLTYDGFAGGSVGDPVTGCLGLFDLDNALFFYTCSGSWPLIDLDLSGNCVSDDILGTDDEFDWHLSGIPCSASASVTPQGVCVGPTPVP